MGAVHALLGSELPDEGAEATDVSTWRDRPGHIHPLLARQGNFSLLAGLNKCVMNKQSVSRSFLPMQYNSQEVIENDNLPFTSLDWKVESEGTGKEMLQTRTSLRGLPITSPGAPQPEGEAPGPVPLVHPFISSPSSTL